MLTYQPLIDDKKEGLLEVLKSREETLHQAMAFPSIGCWRRWSTHGQEKWGKGIWTWLWQDWLRDCHRKVVHHSCQR